MKVVIIGGLLAIVLAACGGDTTKTDAQTAKRSERAEIIKTAKLAQKLSDDIYGSIKGFEGGGYEDCSIVSDIPGNLEKLQRLRKALENYRPESNRVVEFGELDQGIATLEGATDQAAEMCGFERFKEYGLEPDNGAALLKGSKNEGESIEDQIFGLVLLGDSLTDEFTENFSGLLYNNCASLRELAITASAEVNVAGALKTLSANSTGEFPNQLEIDNMIAELEAQSGQGFDQAEEACEHITDTNRRLAE